MLCCVCERDWPDHRCKVLPVSDEERDALKDIKLPESYAYCEPCWKVLSDKTMGAQLIKGVIQQMLLAQGTPYAEVLAQNFYRRLIGLKEKQ